jgi:DtxR family transcriptional regulator, Mn-dependent transcriptional regulator
MALDVRSLPTRTVDCLKVCYKLHERGERITTSVMRERLQALEPSGQLSDATVTQLFKWLAEKGYVRHTPYHGIVLTAEGETAAAELARHHRLLETFLVQIMGFSLDEVDAEAERMEHAISEAFEDRMDAMLHHPTTDPHGDPIPSKMGQVVVMPMQPLSELQPGTRVVVRRVSDDNADMLRYLSSIGLVPGAAVVIESVAPYGDVYTLRVGETRQVVGGTVMQHVLVSPEFQSR